MLPTNISSSGVVSSWNVFEIDIQEVHVFQKLKENKKDFVRNDREQPKKGSSKYFRLFLINLVPAHLNLV